MKTALFVVVLICYSIVLKAQFDTTITLQPGPLEGIDVPLFEHSPTGNPDKSPEFISYRWNFSSQYTTGISLIRFEIPKLNPRFEVKSAYLSLYHNATSGSAGQVGDNACHLKKVTSRWAVDTVTWNTRPTTITTDQVLLPKSTTSNQNYLDIDITHFVTDWYKNPKTNYGMMLEVIDKSSSQKSMKFCSSNSSDAKKRPKLVIEFREKVQSDTCITIQPSPNNGVDIPLFEHTPDGNADKSPEFISYHWDFSSSNFTSGYSLIQFDLPSVRSNYKLVSASLSLYHNSTSGSAGQIGSNACHLKKVTSKWAVDSVTWNTMPSTTTDNQVYLPTSTSANQNYPNIDILNFANDWNSNPKLNYGMMLQVIDKSSSKKSMKFCSSDCDDASLRPKLELCYQIQVGTQNDRVDRINIYPNPSHDVCHMSVNRKYAGVEAVVELYSVDGLKIHHNTELVSQNGQVEINLLEWHKPGLYIVKTTLGDQQFVNRLVIY